MSPTSKKTLLQDPKNSRFAWHDLKKNVTLSKFLLENFQNGDHGALSKTGKKALNQLGTVNEDQALLLTILSLLSRVSLGSFIPKPTTCSLKELLQLAQQSNSYALHKRHVSHTGDMEIQADPTLAKTIVSLGTGILARACPKASLSCQLTKTKTKQRLVFTARGHQLPIVPRGIFAHAEKLALKHQPWFGLAVYLAALPAVVRFTSGRVLLRGANDQIELIFTFPL